MNKNLSLTLSLALAVTLIALGADQGQAQTAGKQLGKGAMYHYGPFDNDGDGIPNGQDPDYVRPQDGTGHKFGKMDGAGKMNGMGKMYGKSNGQGLGQRNRSGSGAGVCDGTGPKGHGR